jgi:hypothetical protein
MAGSPFYQDNRLYPNVAKAGGLQSPLNTFIEQIRHEIPLYGRRKG